MRPSYGWPITLAVVMISLVITLIVGWIVLTVREIDHSAVFWVLLFVGTTFLLLVLVGVVLYLFISIKGIRLNQRQSNFIDSVTPRAQVADRVAQAISANALAAERDRGAAGQFLSLHARRRASGSTR